MKTRDKNAEIRDEDLEKVTGGLVAACYDKEEDSSVFKGIATSDNKDKLKGLLK